jgi:predicted alpha/beta hydrolase
VWNQIIETVRQLNLLQLLLLGAVALPLAYWVLGAGFRLAHRAVLLVAVLVVALVVLRLLFPDWICGLPLPSPLMRLCV